MVSPRNPEKYVVVDPLHQGTDAIALKEVCTGISNHAIDAAGRSKPKIVADVNCKLVILL